MVNVSKPLSYYRVHSENLSKKEKLFLKLSSWIAILKVKRKILNFRYQRLAINTS